MRGRRPRRSPLRAGPGVVRPQLDGRQQRFQPVSAQRLAHHLRQRLYGLEWGAAARPRPPLPGPARLPNAPLRARRRKPGVGDTPAGAGKPAAVVSLDEAALRCGRRPDLRGAGRRVRLHRDDPARVQHRRSAVDCLPARPDSTPGIRKEKQLPR